jgi:hypothetical protein
VFPIFRRSAGGRNLYRIDGPRVFTELQRIGRRYVLHRVEAQAYPELLRIQDMITMTEGAYEPLTERAWNEALAAMP